MLTRFSTAFALIFILFANSAVLADNAAKPEITQTIQRQLDALIKDDFEQAFSYASPNIKGIFGTAERFGTMVAQGYPMVHRTSDVRFLELREIAGALYQKVQVRDAEGRIHFLDYHMIQSETVWQINGVQILQASGLSA